MQSKKFEIIKISHIDYVKDYKINIFFSDGTCNLFNYKPLVTSNHEEFKQYLDITKFKKCKVVNNKMAVAWGKTWDMILPIETLYNKKFVKK